MGGWVLFPVAFMIVPWACDPFGFWVMREVGTPGDKGTQGVTIRESEQGGKKTQDRVNNELPK